MDELEGKNVPLVSPSDEKVKRHIVDCSPLQWDEFFDKKESIDVDGDSFNVYRKGVQGPVFYLLHGGGYSGLTWACFAEQLHAKIDCRIVAPDLRGHGETVCKESGDLSTARQVKDIASVYEKLFGNDAPALIVVGHSMGGALAVHTVHAKLLPNVMALAVIDVVEGSALSALTAMPSFLRGRPQQFQSEERAIRWCIESGTTINHRAARISMPSQIVAASSGEQSTHWDGWFRGLSQKFLDCPGSKILILANVDSLDKKLLTGQMRGMFQTEVLPKVGHAVHEDSPEQVAQIFVNLINRYRVLFDKAKPIKIHPP